MNPGLKIETWGTLAACAGSSDVLGRVPGNCNEKLGTTLSGTAQADHGFQVEGLREHIH